MRLSSNLTGLMIGLSLIFLPGPVGAQGDLQALSTLPLGALGYAMSGIGWSFVPTSDLLVTAISSTAPQVTFWQGGNQVLATYAYTGPIGTVYGGPQTSFQAVSPLFLSAGQTYFMSTQAADLNSSVLFFVFELNGAEGLGPFVTSPYISQFASYYLSSEGQWSSPTTPASENANYLLLGPNFQFQVVPEPASCGLWVLAAGVLLFRKRPRPRHKHNVATIRKQNVFTRNGIHTTTGHD